MSILAMLVGTIPASTKKWGQELSLAQAELTGKIESAWCERTHAEASGKGHLVAPIETQRQAVDAAWQRFHVRMAHANEARKMAETISASESLSDD